MDGRKHHAKRRNKVHFFVFQSNDSIFLNPPSSNFFSFPRFSVYSRLAMTTKVTLDQVLGGIIWQAALLSINEPYRAAALDLYKKVAKNVKTRVSTNMKKTKPVTATR